MQSMKFRIIFKHLPKPTSSTTLLKKQSNQQQVESAFYQLPCTLNPQQISPRLLGIQVQTQRDESPTTKSEKNTGKFRVGEIRFPDRRCFRQKEIPIVFFLHEFKGMYPSGMIYNVDRSLEGIYNHVWNEMQNKNFHSKKTLKWVQACRD